MTGARPLWGSTDDDGDTAQLVELLDGAERWLQLDLLPGDERSELLSVSLDRPDAQALALALLGWLRDTDPRIDCPCSHPRSAHGPGGGCLVEHCHPDPLSADDEGGPWWSAPAGRVLIARTDDGVQLPCGAPHPTEPSWVCDLAPGHTGHHWSSGAEQ